DRVALASILLDQWNLSATALPPGRGPSCYALHVIYISRHTRSPRLHVPRQDNVMRGFQQVKQPLTEVRGFILRSKQTLQNSPNMPELYTRAEAPGPTYFLVGLHRLLDRAERVNVLCRTSRQAGLRQQSPDIRLCRPASIGIRATGKTVAQFLP